MNWWTHQDSARARTRRLVMMMTAAVLAAGGHDVLCTAGNLNNHLGVPLTLCDAPHEPTTMVIEAGESAAAVRRTRSMIVKPAIWCRTFGTADFMRVPLPAASTTTWMSPTGLFSVH